MYIKRSRLLKLVIVFTAITFLSGSNLTSLDFGVSDVLVGPKPVFWKKWFNKDFEVKGRLEDSVPGFWLKRLNIAYSNPKVDLVTRLRKIVLMRGRKIDYVSLGEDYGYYRFVIPSLPLYFEVYDKQLEVDVVFRPPGISFKRLMGDKYIHRKKNFKYPCNVVFSSQKDNARLLLCGTGDYCQKIVLLPGS
jgi:hypothetical protein